LAGDVRTVARLIRDIDDGMPQVVEVLKCLYPYTGNACVIGITGAPGVGKSTLVDQMIFHLRKRNKAVGVLAVDPTSPFSGGAILGDRIRMQRHSMDKDVFIRSLATRGTFGGLTQSTRGAIDVIDAMGKDFILVETVGVGQDEIDVVKSAHTTVIVVIPGMGDDVQAIKAGILETGDIFVVNKADREGADKTLGELRLMLDLAEEKYRNGQWRPPVILAQAAFDIGVRELLDQIEAHRRYRTALDGELQLRFRRDRAHHELCDILKSRLIEKVFWPIVESKQFESAVGSIVEERIDPYSAADNLIFLQPESVSILSEC
jgi:LAO/AO transport system kinase